MNNIKSELWLTKHDIENAYHPIIGSGQFSGELGTHPATNSNENYGVWSEQNRKLVDPFWGIAGFFTGFEGKFGEDATNEIEYELDGVGKWNSVDGDNAISWRSALLNSMNKHPDGEDIFEDFDGFYTADELIEDTLESWTTLDYYDYYDENPGEFLEDLRVEIGEWYEGREDFYFTDDDDEEDDYRKPEYWETVPGHWIDEMDKPLDIRIKFTNNYELKKDLPKDFVPNPRYKSWKSAKVIVRMKGGKLSTFGGHWETNGEARFVPKSSLMGKDSVSSCNPAKGICNCMTSYRKRIRRNTPYGFKKKDGRNFYFGWITVMPRKYNQRGRLTYRYRNACFNKPGWGKNAKKDDDTTTEHITTTILKAAPRRKFQLKGASKPKKAEQPTKATAPTRRRERKRGGVLQSFKQD